MSTVRAFDAYKTYVALKLHFSNEKYDYFTNRGQSRANPKAFEQRNDHYQFQKLAKKHNQKSLEELLVANLLENPELWVGDLFSETAMNYYYERKKVRESLTYTFKEDLRKLKTLEKENDRPLLITATLQKEISIETFSIMCETFDLYKKFDKVLKDDIIWNELKKKTKKYIPFLQYEKEKFKKIVEEINKENI